MSVKNFFSWGIIFFISFFLSSFLGMISGVSFFTLFFRALFSSLIMVLLAWGILFIIKKYFPEIYSVFQKEKEESEESSTENPSFVNTEDTFSEDSSISAGNKKSDPSGSDDLSFNNVWEENKEKLNEPTFYDLEKEIGWNNSSSDNSEGLKKVTKERFSSEDPQVMAQTIRHILVDDKKS